MRLLLTILIFGIAVTGYCLIDPGGETSSATQTYAELEGRLQYTDKEWFLLTDNDPVKLKFPEQKILEKVNLKIYSLDEVKISGFFDTKEIFTVETLEKDGKVYSLIE